MRDKNNPDYSLLDLDYLTREIERFKKLGDQLQVEVDNYKESTALKEEQLERAERNLKELQKNIVKENEGVRKQLNEFAQNEKMKQGLQMNEINRNFQERDKKLFEKLKELADSHEPLLPVKKKTLKDLKDDKDGLVVNTVRIFYHKNLKEGDDRRIDVNEFVEAKSMIEKWVGPIADPEATFATIDKNGGGQILFDEFVEWAIKKNLDLEDDDD